MATRSAIAIAHGDRIKGVYCHWDGYVEYTGFILRHFYRDSVLVNRLISMGDISNLGREIGQTHDFRERATYVTVYGKEVANQCTFYNRDRGEETSWLSFEDSKHFVREYTNWGCEYFYLFKDGQWFVKGRKGPWKSLSKALAKALDK